MQRIDQDNLAMMHRLESASSAYSQYLLKPKHFQDPRLGLYPRWVAVSMARRKRLLLRTGGAVAIRTRDELKKPCVFPLVSYHVRF